MDEKYYAHDAHCNTVHKPGPEPCPPPREADDIEALAQFCSEALRGPQAAHELLVSALMCLKGDDGADPTADEIAASGAYSRIAEVLLLARADERAAAPDTMADPEAAGPEPSPLAYVPQPVTGRRFTVDIEGRYLGMVGGRDWLFHPAAGYVDVTGGYTTLGRAAQPADDGAVLASVTLQGRIVSATPDHILGITDGGVGVTLRRALVTEVEDAGR